MRQCGSWVMQMSTNDARLVHTRTRNMCGRTLSSFNLIWHKIPTCNYHPCDNAEVGSCKCRQMLPGLFTHEQETCVAVQSTGNPLPIAIHWQSAANCNPLAIHWQWQFTGRPTATANQMQYTMCMHTQCTLLWIDRQMSLACKLPAIFTDVTNAIDGCMYQGIATVCAMQYVTCCRCGPHAILRSCPFVFAREHLAMYGL